MKRTLILLFIDSFLVDWNLVYTLIPSLSTENRGMLPNSGYSYCEGYIMSAGCDWIGCESVSVIFLSWGNVLLHATFGMENVQMRICGQSVIAGVQVLNEISAYVTSPDWGSILP